jgi:hypothetical protein
LVVLSRHEDPTNRACHHPVQQNRQPDHEVTQEILKTKDSPDEEDEDKPVITHELPEIVECQTGTPRTVLKSTSKSIGGGLVEPSVASGIGSRSRVECATLIIGSRRALKHQSAPIDVLLNVCYTVSIGEGLSGDVWVEIDQQSQLGFGRVDVEEIRACGGADCIAMEVLDMGVQKPFSTCKKKAF